jgi:hypothetical protein
MPVYAHKLERENTLYLPGLKPINLTCISVLYLLTNTEEQFNQSYALKNQSRCSNATATRAVDQMIRSVTQLKTIQSSHDIQAMM